jgi:2-oxoglutarate dehydrogenase E1 component
VWCQEEPQNQGAWYQIRHRLQEPLGDGQQLYYAGRESAAAPACGILKLHIRQQQELVEAALGIEIAASKSDGLDESPKKQRSKRRNKPRKS